MFNTLHSESALKYTPKARTCLTHYTVKVNSNKHLKQDHV